MFAAFAKNDGFPRAKLFPLIGQLGEYLKIGFEHYVHTQVQGKRMSAETLSIYLLSQMVEWDPKVNSKSLLDEDTKQAAARFLAGVAINLINDGE